MMKMMTMMMRRMGLALLGVLAAGAGFDPVDASAGERDRGPFLVIPEARRTVVVEKTIVIGAGNHRDFGYTRLVPARALGDGSQREGQKPVILLMPGASVSRVIIGAPGADGIWCRGRNLLEDVYFENVGEDAVTVMGKDVRWIGGGARHAEDKIVQMNHKGPFYGENLVFEDFGIAVRGNGNKKYRKTPFQIHLKNVTARDGKSLVRLSSKDAKAVIEDCRVYGVSQALRVSEGARVKDVDGEVLAR